MVNITNLNISSTVYCLLPNCVCLCPCHGPAPGPSPYAGAVGPWGSTGGLQRGLELWGSAEGPGSEGLAHGEGHGPGRSP